MKIGELARRAGCDVQTVRFYEREGLLPDPPREASGYRRYTEENLTQLNFIRHCRSLDIPLPEVRQLLSFAKDPAESCGDVNGLLDRHIALIQERVASLQNLQDQLIGLRKTCAGDSTHSCAILQSFVRAAEGEICACHPSPTRTSG